MFVLKQNTDAFVSEDEFSSILISRFRNMLNDALAHTAKFIDQLVLIFLKEEKSTLLFYFYLFIHLFLFHFLS